MSKVDHAIFQKIGNNGAKHRIWGLGNTTKEVGIKEVICPCIIVADPTAFVSSIPKENRRWNNANVENYSNQLGILVMIYRR